MVIWEQVKKTIFCSSYFGWLMLSEWFYTVFSRFDHANVILAEDRFTNQGKRHGYFSRSAVIRVLQNG